MFKRSFGFLSAMSAIVGMSLAASHPVSVATSAPVDEPKRKMRKTVVSRAEKTWRSRHHVATPNGDREVRRRLRQQRVIADKKRYFELSDSDQREFRALIHPRGLLHSKKMARFYAEVIGAV